MLENILLAIVLLLEKAVNHFVGYFLPFVNAGEYSVGNSLTICICWSIFCWLLSSH